MVCIAAIAFSAGYFLAAPEVVRVVPSDDATSAPPVPSADRVREVLKDPDGFSRAARLARLLPLLDPSSLPGLEPILADPNLEMGPTELLLLVRYWATIDPTAAAAWTQSEAPPAYRAAANGLAIELWARADPDAVLRSIRDAGAVGVGLSPDIQQRALIRGWIASEKPGLEDYIRDLGVGFDRQLALSTYARARIRGGEAESVRRWAESLPDEPQRFKLAAFRQIGSELTIHDPAEGVAWCDRHCDGPFGSSLRQLVATRWAAIDGYAAMQWLSRLPDDESRNEAVRGAFIGWQRSDPEALIAFVEDMGFESATGSWFQPAVLHYARLIGLTRPAEALRWAASVEDPAQREETSIAIVQHWRKNDPSAADAWLGASALSEDAQAKAREPLPEPRRKPSRSSRGPAPQ